MLRLVQRAMVAMAAGGARRRAALAAVAAWLVLSCLLVAQAGATPGISIRYALDGRADAALAHGTIVRHGAASRSHARWRIVLQQRRGSRWRTRARRIVIARGRTVHFTLRWSDPPAGRRAVVRVSVFAGRRLVVRSAIKSVVAGDPGTVFYSGKGDAGAGDVGDYNIRLVENFGLLGLGRHEDGRWTTGTPCDTSNAVPGVSKIYKEPITELAGFSLGRLGPIYFLRQAPSWESQISYILLLDPGAEGDMSPCDPKPEIAPGKALAGWLGQRSGNRLVIIAGPATLSDNYKGLDTYYLADLPAAVRSQVMICSKKTPDHTSFLIDSKGGFGWMVGAPAPQSCPSGTQARRGWPAPGTSTSPGGTSPGDTGTHGDTNTNQNPAASVHLDRGAAAPAGYWYAVSLSGFGAGADVTVSCRDSASPAGFRTFTLHTDPSGAVASQSGCYSGDGPDHWVVAGTTESNHVSWSTATSQPPPPVRVTPYNNYGPANAGRAMCRGNPGRPESMPGGTASQSFTVPAGVASLDAAMVQIDPDGSVTAHATLFVNGQARASTASTAAGDTSFSFAPVAVAAGEQVTLSISFTASSGKIITVYTAGSPGGVFSASNSCPDGAPSLSTGATGLRATVSGWSS